MRRYAWFGAALTAPCGPSASRLLCALFLVALALSCAEKAEPTQSVESDSKTFLPGDPVDLDGDGLPDGVAVDSDGDGVADGVDTDGDGTADVPLPGGPPLPEEEEEEEEEDECPDENPYCDEEPPDPDGCSGEQTFELEPVGVKIMFAVDGSNSMEKFWPQVQAAIKATMEGNPGFDYGVHLFWSEPVENIIDGITRVNFCGQTQNAVLDVAAAQQAQVLPFMGAAPPGPGNIFFDFTPVVEPLNYYLTNPSQLASEDTTNYLVLISDGNDNCFGTAFAGMDDKNLAYEKLANELVKKNIRILPVGFDASGNQVTLGGMVMTNFAALDTLARHGGTGLGEALAADKPEDLAKALDVVSKKIRPCRFRIPAALDPGQNLNPFELGFFLAGTKVPRDRTEHQGWDFVDGDTSEVEFYGMACEAVQLGATLTAKKGCETDVCGQAATKVSTKPSAVLYVLDSSASMAGCSQPGFACLPKPLGNDDLTFWGVATQSISASTVAPINDHVEFGLQEFPAIGSGLGACDVATVPEVPTAQGTEISIIGKMLADLPTGQTPLVQGLEAVAAAPGRLADDGVRGAVIVVSDGGHSQGCGNITPTDAVTRLSQGALALKERGINTYAVRFGPKGSDFADQDRQLRAIVESGGTATGDPTDPNNVPYLDAPDRATLNAALAEISDKLASCKLTLGSFDVSTDPAKSNLYLNGEIVPYDATSQDGWTFTDPSSKEVELFGSWCDRFKTNRVSSIVIELGCRTVIVQ